MKRNRGFTLVELMITVAIMSVLASIAIPNYVRFTQNAKKIAAKISLSQLYTLEKSFWIEYSTYSTRLDAIGFSPTGQQIYDVGFDVDLAVYPAGVPLGTANCIQTCPVTCPNATWTCHPMAMNGLDGNFVSTATTSTFRAEAHIHWAGQTNVSEKDSWSIDQNRSLQPINTPN